jgi:hypothetical protein
MLAYMQQQRNNAHKCVLVLAWWFTLVDTTLLHLGQVTVVACGGSPFSDVITVSARKTTAMSLD